MKERLWEEFLIFYLLIMDQLKIFMLGYIFIGRDLYEICETGMLVLKYNSRELLAAWVKISNR